LNSKFEPTAKNSQDAAKNLVPTHHPHESLISGSTTNGTSGKMSLNAFSTQFFIVTATESAISVPEFAYQSFNRSTVLI
jgi:hypothetical protein